MRTYYRVRNNDNFARDYGKSTAWSVTTQRQEVHSYGEGSASVVQWARADSIDEARDLPDAAWSPCSVHPTRAIWVAPPAKTGRKPKNETGENRQFRCPAVLWGRAEREAARRGCNGVGELLRQLILALPE